MTGRYPVHLGLQSNVIFWDTPWAPSLDNHMIPQLLSEHAGYNTAMFGAVVYERAKKAQNSTNTRARAPVRLPRLVITVTAATAD